MKGKFQRNTLYTAVLTTSLVCGVENVLADNNYGIEEVVVTAQKRSQNLQDIGIAVTAFSGDDIRDLGLGNPKDLAAQTPGMDIKTSVGNQNPIITIRGVGLNDVNANNNPSAAVHVDEVYLSSAAYLGFQLFDIERVEVLKGPQGTLYGRNTTAGAVNFIAAKPTDAFAAGVTTTLANYETFETEGYISGPLNENVRGRIAVSYKQSDGHIENVGTVGFAGLSGDPAVPGIPDIGSDHVGGMDVFSWRTTLEADLSDTVSLTLGLHGSRDKSENAIYKWNGSFSGALTDLNYSDTQITDDVYTVAATRNPKVDADAFGGYLRMEADLPFASFVSLTGYESLDRTMEEEDGSPMRFFDQDYSDDIWSASQEFRLTNSSDNGLTWVAGLYFGKEKLDIAKEALTTDDFLTHPFTEFTQEGESLGVFGQLEIPVTDTIKVTAGLRYTDEEKTYDGGSVDLKNFGFDPLEASNRLVPGRTTTIDTQKWADEDISGKLAIDYTPNNDWLFYGSISKGFKSGGFDGSTIVNVKDQTGVRPADPIFGVNPLFQPFESETVLSYEAGFKSTLLDNTLQLNGAVFFYDYQDMQVEANVATDIGNNSIRTNAGKSEIKGLELELWWRPLVGLDIKAGVALLDTEITQWEGADSQLFEGNQAPDAPEQAFNAMLRYELPLNNGMILAPSLDMNYADAVFKTVGNEPFAKADAYFLANARLTLNAADETWHTALWVKNLADREYVANVRVFEAGAAEQLVYGMPRTFGITFSYNWL